MATDDERREVAERLRGLRRGAHNVTQLNHGPTWSLAWCVLGDGLDECGTGDWFERMCARLADLIDPGDTSQGCRDTVACDPTGRGVDSIREWCRERLYGADGAEAYMLCSVISAIDEWRHPERATALTVRPVDRERLARLSRLLIVTADGYQADYPHTMRTKVAADDLRNFARCIYKALGEVAE